MSLFAVLGFASVAAAVTNLNPSPQVPQGASKPVDPSFPSFAIQGSTFPFYTGNSTHPNEFSANLIQGIQNRTGAPLVVRVGGTNTDFSRWNPTQTEPTSPKQTDAGIGAKFTFGPDFYTGFQNWPDTRWIYDVPFANLDKATSLGEAQAAVKGIGSDKLEGLEIGNEPAYYGGQGVRNKTTWSPTAYATQFNSYADWLVGQLGISGNKLFQALTLGDAKTKGWTVQAAIEGGLLNGGKVQSISLHHYETTITSGDKLQSTLMSHGFVKSGIDNYDADISYLQTNYPDLPIIFGESGRYAPGPSSTDNSEGIFGAALWTADYLLYLMTKSVHRVNMQLGAVFGYVAWHPVAINGLTPGVRSPYFGHLLVSEFMGKSTNFRVAEVETGNDQLAVYAGYDNGALKRIVIINYNVWNGQGTRPVSTYSVAVPSGVTKGTVKTLTSPGGATANGYFYWAGLAFSYPNKGIGTKAPSQPQPSSVAAQNGRVNVNVGSSEAILLEL